MHILELLREQIDSFPPMTDREFLHYIIKNASCLFRGEMIAIKNSTLEYIAMSDEYAYEFNLDQNALGKKIVNNLTDIDTELAILQQEQEILERYPCQDSICFYQKNGKTEYCGIRKRQLINPFNNNVVGILIVAGKFKPGILRKSYLKLFVPNKSLSVVNKEQKLTSSEQQIIFALLLGFHSRKEISAMLSNVTKEKINEIKVKNGLNALYQKFHCSSISQLLTLISNDMINLELPPDVFASGNYPIE